jgi:hypothetical protein
MRPSVFLLFGLLSLLVSIAQGTNYYGVHGHNFTYLEYQGPEDYDEILYAPVIWDARTAFEQLMVYYRSYGWDEDEECEDAYAAMALLLEEAADHGVDFVNLRYELAEMDDPDTGPLPNQHFVRLARLAHGQSMYVIA